MHLAASAADAELHGAPTSGSKDGAILGSKRPPRSHRAVHVWRVGGRAGRRSDIGL